MSKTRVRARRSPIRIQSIGPHVWLGMELTLMADKYIGLFDLLGFKHYINTHGLQELVERAKRFVRMARGAVVIPGAEGEKRISVLVFQDTVAVTTPTASTEDLRCIIQYASGLIGFGFSEGFLLRGAIVRGEAHVDDQMIVGRGFIQAYEMEQNQEWIGCWVQDHCFEGFPAEVVTDLSSYFVVRFFIPLKAGPMLKGWAVNWTAPFHTIKKGKAPPELKTLKEAWDREWKPACTEGAVSWDVRRKLVNTDRFLEELLRLGWLPSED